MKRMMVAAAMTAALVVTGCLTPMGAFGKDASREETISENGLVSITLPNKSWKEVTDTSSAVYFSSGDCAIAVDIYENGADLPAVVGADDNHAMIYETSTSTRDYVLVTTGYVDENYDYAEMKEPINGITFSMEMIRDDMVHGRTSGSEYSVENADDIAWIAASQLNVRESAGTDAVVLGELDYGTKVEVTGIVLKDGKDCGWVRISYEGGDGYISGEFLTYDEIKTPTAPVVVDERTVYTDGGEATTLYEYSDYTWMNKNGIAFVYVVEIDCWLGDDGSALYNYDPTGGEPQPFFQTVTIHDDEGEYVTIHLLESGEWGDDNGRTFEYDANGNCWLSSDGYYFWE